MQSAYEETTNLRMKDGRLNSSCITEELIVFSTRRRWFALLNPERKKQDWVLKETTFDSFPASLQSQRKRVKRILKERRDFNEKTKDLIYSIPRWRNVVIILVLFKPLCLSLVMFNFSCGMSFPFLACATDVSFTLVSCFNHRRSHERRKQNPRLLYDQFNE